MYSITLSNKDCVFDSAKFDTLAETLNWADGRGGTYVIHISKNSRPDVSFSYDSEKMQYRHYNGWDWETVTSADIDSYL